MNFKNIHLLRNHLSATDEEKLQQSAYYYASKAQIYFKVLYASDNEVTLEVRQHKNSMDKYLSSKELIDRAQKLMEETLPGFKINVGAIEYKHPPIDMVTPEWVQQQMTKKKIASKAIVDFTGIDKGTISNWISDNRNMSRSTKAMFYLLLKDEDQPTIESKVSDHVDE